MSILLRASQVPLFDRLLGVAAGSSDGRLLDLPGLTISLRTDLVRLMTTRNLLSVPAYLTSQGSVIHYGLPDLYHLSSQSGADLQTVAAVIAHGIALYEPRLEQVQVHAFCREGENTGVHVKINGCVWQDMLLEPVEFSLALDDPMAVRA